MLADAILRGVFEGDLAVALERAAAFCRVVASGRADRAHSMDAHDAGRGRRRRPAAPHPCSPPART